MVGPPPFCVHGSDSHQNWLLLYDDDMSAFLLRSLTFFVCEYFLFNRTTYYFGFLNLILWGYLTKPFCIILYPAHIFLIRVKKKILTSFITFEILYKEKKGPLIFIFLTILTLCDGVWEDNKIGIDHIINSKMFPGFWCHRIFGSLIKY